MEKLYDFNVDCERLYQEWYDVEHNTNDKNDNYSRLLINSPSNYKEKYRVDNEGKVFAPNNDSLHLNWYSVKKILKKFQQTYTQEVCLLVEDWLNTQGLSATRIKYAALYPGMSKGVHRDYAGYRFHIPIKTNNDCDFFVDGINYKLDCVGSIYRFNSDFLHSIANNGDTVRLHLMFDVRKLNG